MTYTCGGTGEISVKADGIGRRSHIADSGNATFHIRYDLIHAYDQDDMRGSLDQAGYPVAVTVYIDQFAVQSNGIGTHKIVVGKYRFGI